MPSHPRRGIAGGVRTSVLIVELAGRDRELSAAVRALDDVLDGARRALAVLGEAGIGKSAVLGAMAESARARGLW